MGLGLAVLDRMQRDERCVVGSVVVSLRRSKVGYLVGPGSAPVWADCVSDAGGGLSGSRAFGKGGYLLAPGPSATSEARAWWQRGPAGDPDDLTTLTSLADALAAVGRCSDLNTADLMSVVGISGGR